MNKEPWYSVKSISKHIYPPDEIVYEERIVLFRAQSLEEATKRGELEAKKYAKEHSSISNCSHVALINVFHLSEEKIKSGTKVWSIMRASDKLENDFVDHYEDDGTEHTTGFGTEHTTIFPFQEERSWYTAKCIFRHHNQVKISAIYEERIVLFKATSFEEARDLADVEAEDYVSSSDRGVSCTDYMNVFHLFDNRVKSGMEIYSLMRTSDLSEDDFLKHYFNIEVESVKKM